MRVLTTLTGGLLGALPGLLVIVFVSLLSRGVDATPFVGLAGNLLVAAGAVVGSVLGRRAHDRLTERRLGVATTGLAALLLIVGLIVIVSPPGAFLGGLWAFLPPIVIGLLVGLPLSTFERGREKKAGSGTGRRLLTILVGGLIGLIPFVLLLTFARFTGLDESSSIMYFGLPGYVLLGGIIAGASVGWRMHHRFADHPMAVAVTGLVTVLMIVGWQIALSNSADDQSFDPIGDGGDCHEVYELLGGIEIPDPIDEVGDVEELYDEAEIVGLPDDLSDSEIQTLEEKLIQFEQESPIDPACDRLRADLEALQ